MLYDKRKPSLKDKLLKGLEKEIKSEKVEVKSKKVK